MSADSYIGVNGRPKHIEDIYVGVNGVPKRVVQGWVGIGNGQKGLWYDGNYDPPAPLNHNCPFYKSSSGKFVVFGGRWYAKVNTGEAYVAGIWTNFGWTGAYIVAQYKDYVDGNCSYNESVIGTYKTNGGKFVMYRHKWFWVVVPYAWQGHYTVYETDGSTPSDRFIDLSSNPDTSDWEGGAKEFVRYIHDNYGI